MSERKSNGWKPGQSGNPKGKAPGSGHLQKLRAELAVHTPEIVDMLVMAAKGGDIQAARLLLERVFPPVKATEQPVQLSLPSDGSLSVKAEAILSAAAGGEIAPSQAAQLITALGTVSKIVEVDELEARIAELERQHEQRTC